MSTSQFIGTNRSEDMLERTSLKLLVAGIFLSSLGAVLFSLSIFRLLSFFIMPSMFFALLLVGFPIGAALAARRHQADVRRFQRMLTVMQIVMVLSILATLGCKHVDYMRANLLFGIDPVRLLVQVLVFALIYLSFFAAYGAAEYIGYLAGTQAFGGGMRPVYALFLFGGAAAFGLAELLQRPLGVPRLLLLAVAAVSGSRLILGRGVRLRRGVELVVLLAVVCWPAFDRTFMNWFKLPSTVNMSAAWSLDQSPENEVAFAGWGKYSYVEIIRRSIEEGKTRTESTQEAERIRLSMVVVSSPAEAERVLEGLRRGGAFPGQALGFVVPSDLDPRFFEGVVDLKVGEVSEVIGTEKGYFLFKRLDENYYSGFYNDVGMWNVVPQMGSDALLSRDRIPFLFLPEEGSVAIIGSGGGRGVIYSRMAGAGRILAMEIEPVVVETIQGPLREDFAEAYTKEPVETYVGEARGYFERTDERFDMIMLMSVGGYPQLMLEPGNMIRTTEAFQLFVDHLNPGGVLAIGYDVVLDDQGILLRQYYNTLRLLGMDGFGFVDEKQGAFELLAFPSDASPEQKAEWSSARRQFAVDHNLVPLRDPEMELSDFRQITDNRPFLAGNISNILSEGDIRWMFKVLVVLLVAAGSVLGVILWRPLRGKSLPVHPTVLMGIGILLGANFILIEHLCVIHLFRNLYSYYDSLIIGIVSFLTITGLGSLLISKRHLSRVILGALVIAVILWLGAPAWHVAAVVAVLVPVVLVTGTFFPLIFEQVPMGRLQLFGMDALGTAMGATLAFFVPILFGFHAFTTVAVCTFLVTGICILVFLFSRDWKIRLEHKD